MKYERWLAASVFLFLIGLSSCGNENEMVTRPTVQPNPLLNDPSGLVGTYSGKVENSSYTKSGTLTITITNYDVSSGLLTGSLSLTGFSDCYTTGKFPDPDLNNNYDSHYIPQRGFGSINAVGPEPGSYSFLYFLPSDFTKGLDLNGSTEGLGFYDGHTWCAEINNVFLPRVIDWM